MWRACGTSVGVLSVCSEDPAESAGEFKTHRVGKAGTQAGVLGRKRGHAGA